MLISVLSSLGNTDPKWSMGQFRRAILEHFISYYDDIIPEIYVGDTQLLNLSLFLSPEQCVLFSLLQPCLQDELLSQFRSPKEWAKAKTRAASTMSDNVTLAILRHMLNVSCAPEKLGTGAYASANIVPDAKRDR